LDKSIIPHCFAAWLTFVNASIFQKLWISPDERLEKYIQENDIIDIDVDEALLVSDFDEDKECDEEFD
jgi:hypothetical protein